MFTGIVEEIGTVSKVQQRALSMVLEICAKTVLENTKIGDSIAINGICLTVTSLHPGIFTVDVMHETLNRSILARLTPGSHVNLERAMQTNARFGGHLVSGHVDGTGTILQIQRDDNAIWFTIQANTKLMRYIVEKGSIAIDGISLTVAKVEKDTFSISAIPHTVQQTTLSERKAGELVHLEADIIGKYVERLLECTLNSQSSSNITKSFLEKYEF